MTHPPGPDPGWASAGPAGPSSEDRGWALAAHLGTIVAFVLAMGFLAPLMVLVVRGHQSPFVRRHAVESLNFQISLLIYLVASVVLGFVITLATFGLGVFLLLPVAIVAGIALLVAILVASVRAWNGEEFRYPLTMRFLN